MNPFNKNPFANSNTPSTKIVGNNVQFNEKQKLENIRENMAKLKFQNHTPQTPQPEQPNQQVNSQNLKEQMDFLRKLDK